MGKRLSDNYSPKDILLYVLDNNLESDFMTMMEMHKGGFSIAEIPDKSFWVEEGIYHFESKQYNASTVIDDEKVIAAIREGRYVSAFISRFNDSYQAHFLVHDCMNSEKEQNDDEIVIAVVQYMIFKTILALKLDTPEKVDMYIGKKADN